MLKALLHQNLHHISHHMLKALHLLMLSFLARQILPKRRVRTHLKTRKKERNRGRKRHKKKLQGMLVDLLCFALKLR